MTSTELKFGIPNIELSCASGKRINPSSFAGHEFIALFCPLDPAEAASEIATFRRQYPEFVKHDAWILTFVDNCSEAPADDGRRTLTIPDAKRQAWVAFRNLTEHPEQMDRDSGATFLFTRGGGLHRYWHGAGHVDEVLAELRTPSFQHPHQVAG